MARCVRIPMCWLWAAALLVLCGWLSQAQGQWTQRLPPVIPRDSPLVTRSLPPQVHPLPRSAPAAAWASYPTAQPASYLDPNADLAVPRESLGETPPASYLPPASQLPHAVYLPDVPPGAQLPPEAYLSPAPQLPPGAKPGVLQRVIFVNTWLSGSERDDIEMFDSEFRFSLGFPFPTVASPLVVSPGVGAHWLDGPDAPDLPSRVYDAYVDFMWKIPVSEQFKFDLAVTPGWYSDLEQSNSDALRIGGRIIGFYSWSPTTQLVAGVAYLDREDVSFLPIGGVVYLPRDDLRFDLVFPKPRIAWRYVCEGEFSSWWYVAGEFGGGSWAIERVGGLEDMANYTDWRISIGQEIKRAADSIAWVEIGYVFNRELSYNSGTPDFEPGNTVVVRAGVGY